MAYGLPKFEARITVPTGGYTLTVTDSGGTATVTILTAGDYYLTSATALLSTIGTALTANATLAGTYTLTLDDDSASSTGRVTIAASGGGNPSITWTSTTLRNLLGFTGNLSGAASYTSTNATKALFLPNVPRAEPLVPDGHAGLRVSDATFTTSPSGVSKCLIYNTRYVNALAFRFLSGRKTYTQYETYANESFESFWANNVSVPWRYHYDRSVDGTYVTDRIAQPGMFPVRASIPTRWGGVGTDGATLHYDIGPIETVKNVDA